MTKEQYLNDRIAELRTLLADGLEQNKIEVTEKSERLIQSFLENTISSYKAINEKSFFDKALDQIDNGWGAVGEKLGHDNISGHEVVNPRDWSNATLDDIPVGWMPEKGQKYWADGTCWVYGDIEMVEHLKNKFGRLFPTARLAQMYLDSQNPGEGLKPRDWSNATLEDVPVNWMPEKGQVGYATGYNGGRLFPTKELLQMYLDSHKPVERWKPEYGDKYWTVDDSGFTYDYTWLDDSRDEKLFQFGNIFRTEQEALAAIERVKKALLG